MKSPFSIILRISVFAVAFSLLSCEEPRLRTQVEDPGVEKEAPVERAEILDPIEEARKAVIGKDFESLTLGTRKFFEVTVRAITDEGITLSHADGVEEIPWREVPEEVREEWGFDPSSASIVERVMPSLVKPKKETGEEEKEKPTVASAPAVSATERARQVALKRQMLEAQRKGIETLESDLSRHSLQLNGMKSELQRLRVLKSNQGGGIRVERIGGESTLVDRGQQIRELQAKIQVEEQLVVQLSRSLEKARADYLRLSQEIASLRGE